MLPLETLSPGDPSEGVVYLRIVLSPEQASHLWMFLNISVLQGRVVSTSPNPPAGGPLLVGCPRLPIQFIRSYPPYRRPFLYPQPKDGPVPHNFSPFYLNVSQLQLKFRTVYRVSKNAQLNLQNLNLHRNSIYIYIYIYIYIPDNERKCSASAFNFDAGRCASEQYRLTYWKLLGVERIIRNPLSICRCNSWK